MQQTYMQEARPLANIQCATCVLCLLLRRAGKCPNDHR